MSFWLLISSKCKEKMEREKGEGAMLGNAKWIAMKDMALSPWKTEKYSAEKKEQLAGTAQVEVGSFLFRKEYDLEKEIEKAEIAISGMGYYELFVNGCKPDPNRVLTPIVSDYFRLVHYDTYDITDLLKKGKNVFGVEVGGGWFSNSPKYWGWQNSWYGNPRMIAQATIIYMDGTVKEIVSDDSWLWQEGCILETSIYDGEIVDFNRISEDWKKIGFDCSEWKHAVYAEAPTDNLQECVAPPVRITRRLRPVDSWKLSETQTVYDFGENGAAVPCVVVKGKKGDTIQLNHAEFIHEDGTLDTLSENRAMCRDIYTLSEQAVHVCQPKFTWHGYRYMMLTVSSLDIEIISVESCVVHSDVEVIGTFNSSSEILNRVHEASVRTELACLQGIPVDCPQRDERKAWLGDAHVTSELCFYNFDMRGLYKSLLEDMIAGKIEGKGVVPFICPWVGNTEDFSIDWDMAYPIFLTEYDERYGDLGLLKHHYQSLKDHVAFYTSLCVDGLLPPCHFGDWLSVDMPEGMQKVAFEAGPDGHRQNPPFAATLFYCKTLRLTADIAERIGQIEDAKNFRELHRQSKEVLLSRYFDKRTGKFGSGGQFLSLYTLYENLIPEEDKEAVFAELVCSLEETEWHPIVGIIGLRYLFDVLVSFGRRDLAYKVLTVEGYPGIFNMVSGEKTTFAENWNGSGSGCHCMWGNFDSTLYKMLGGITFNRRSKYAITIAPYCPEDLTFVNCSQKIEEGTIRVEWKRDADKVRYEIEIPQGMTANMMLQNGLRKLDQILSEGTYEFWL